MSDGLKKSTGTAGCLGPPLQRSLRIGTLRLPSGSYNVSASEAQHEQEVQQEVRAKAKGPPSSNERSHPPSENGTVSNRIRSSLGLSIRPSTKNSSNVADSGRCGGVCHPSQTVNNHTTDPKQLVKCVVLLLDDTKQSFEIHKKSKGQHLIDLVFEHLGFADVERDYFGLQFAERTEDADGMRWLDPSKAIRKQFKLNPPYLFYFRVKFYVGDPCRLTEEQTRYHFFLQTKKDILEGRLVVPQPTAILLASYAVQSELGDYNPDEHQSGYLADMRLVPNQTEHIELKISELHKMHRGQYPSEAEYNFLQHAKRLDMYGVDLHRARVSSPTLKKHLAFLQPQFNHSSSAINSNNSTNHSSSSPLTSANNNQICNSATLSSNDLWNAHAQHPSTHLQTTSVNNNNHSSATTPTANNIDSNLNNSAANVATSATTATTVVSSNANNLNNGGLTKNTLNNSHPSNVFHSVALNNNGVNAGKHIRSHSNPTSMTVHPPQPQTPSANIPRLINKHNTLNSRRMQPPCFKCNATTGIALANCPHQERRNAFSRSALTAAGVSIRKSIRRLPRMVAQLAHSGRSNMTHGASTNASNEFIMRTESNGNLHDGIIGGDGPGGDRATSGGGGGGGAPRTGGAQGDVGVQIGAGVSSASLINPLCMDDEYDSLLGFNMCSYRSCKNLWQSCVEHHAFFRLQSTSYYQNNTRSAMAKKISLFHFGSKFRYSGRSAFETMQHAELTLREKIQSDSECQSSNANILCQQQQHGTNDGQCGNQQGYQIQMPNGLASTDDWLHQTTNNSHHQSHHLQQQHTINHPNSQGPSTPQMGLSCNNQQTCIHPSSIMHSNPQSPAQITTNAPLHTHQHLGVVSNQSGAGGGGSNASPSSTITKMTHNCSSGQLNHPTACLSHRVSQSQSTKINPTGTTTSGQGQAFTTHNQQVGGQASQGISNNCTCSSAAQVMGTSNGVTPNAMINPRDTCSVHSSSGTPGQLGSPNQAMVQGSRSQQHTHYLQAHRIQQPQPIKGRGAFSSSMGVRAQALPSCAAQSASPRLPQSASPQSVQIHTATTHQHQQGPFSHTVNQHIQDRGIHNNNNQSPSQVLRGLTGSIRTSHRQGSQVADDTRHSLTPRKAWTSGGGSGSGSAERHRVHKCQQSCQHGDCGSPDGSNSITTCSTTACGSGGGASGVGGSVGATCSTNLSPQILLTARGLDSHMVLRYADEDDDENSPGSVDCTAATSNVLSTQDLKGSGRTGGSKHQGYGGNGHQVGTTSSASGDKSSIDSINNNSLSNINNNTNTISTSNSNGNGSQCNVHSLQFSNTVNNNNQACHYVNTSSTGNSSDLAQSASTPGSQVSSPTDSIGSASLIKIRLRADDQGRFGFNVKGGVDQNNSPIVVSRVAPNTPADSSNPRLREGDQVLAINGHHVNGLTHDQVVKLIRSWVSSDDNNVKTSVSPSAEISLSGTKGSNTGTTTTGGSSNSSPVQTPVTTGGKDTADKDQAGSSERRRRSKERRKSGQIQSELVLTVRPQAFLMRPGPGDDLDSEPDFQYIPLSSDELESPRVINAVSVPLQESMLLLKEGLETGAVVSQFEQLYRKKPGMSCEHSKLAKNASKNRYKDISPYDSTRVILASDGSSDNDYINASYVIMKVPSSGIVNRYIATQGPLESTCLDFWQMVWQQQSTLVVMLTTLIEKGRLKCYKYWPNLYETQTYGKLQVSCVSEKETPSFSFREFSLINTTNGEERHISHMQYLSWPDHGVPDDATDFLDFIHRVRSNRDAMVEPTIVHCSAGIGRTGVLILMETAMCLIEANEPVYPLEITRVMRDQRAMLIQTPSQYMFVCEAILKVYREAIIKPLPEYQR